ncbi:MAG: hypothetical protein ACOC2W_01600 [bacterium]
MINITITDKKYNGTYYYLWCDVQEDGGDVLKYTFKINSVKVEMSDTELKNKIENAWILKQTGVDLNSGGLVPEPSTPTEPTQEELDIENLETEINDLNVKIKNLILSMKEDDELTKIIQDGIDKKLLSTQVGADSMGIMREKRNRKLTDYNTLKETLETKKEELNTLKGE